MEVKEHNIGPGKYCFSAGSESFKQPSFIAKLPLRFLVFDYDWNYYGEMQTASPEKYDFNWVMEQNALAIEQIVPKEKFPNIKDYHVPCLQFEGDVVPEIIEAVKEQYVKQDVPRIEAYFNGKKSMKEYVPKDRNEVHN